MAKALKRTPRSVTPVALAEWRAKSAEDREVARLDDAIRAVEALVAERAGASLPGAGLPGASLPVDDVSDEVIAQVARRAEVPRAQAGRVLRALQELLAERGSTRLRAD